MAFRETSDFDLPIPGMAMTHELGARPWQSPPQITTVEEGIDFYLSRLVNRSTASRLIEIIEKGIPLTAIAETLTLGGVMQGIHTIDVAVLVNPVLVELMEGLAKNAGVEYVAGDEDEIEEPDDVLLRNAMDTLSKKDRAMFSQDEEQEDTPAEEPTGLMSRREEV